MNEQNWLQQLLQQPSFHAMHYGKSCRFAVKWQSRDSFNYHIMKVTLLTITSYDNSTTQWVDSWVTGELPVLYVYDIAKWNFYSQMSSSNTAAIHTLCKVHVWIALFESVISMTHRVILDLSTHIMALWLIILLIAWDCKQTLCSTCFFSFSY